jgi:scyllo-inositol 2-dehydrogenase (NADP+)
MKAFPSVLAGLLCLAALAPRVPAVPPPVRVAVVGLTHDHALGFFPRLRGRHDIQLVGIVESNPVLIERYARRFHLERSLFHASLAELLADTKVQAVATFTSTFEHRRVVESCAAHGIKTVMMEKPLAVNLEHARAIQAAAKANGMQIIVNYETSWYPGNQAAYRLVRDRHEIGDLRRIVVRDGHQGPKEIGCSPEFLQWLTDPVLNGGGALTDFGCYGADLITWLMGEQPPLSVTAMTQHIKPDVYPKVEDEATVLLTYPKAQGIIEASWNWPFNRKDMDIYGRTGYLLVPKPNLVRLRTEHDRAATSRTLPPVTGPNADPISYLVAVARGDIQPSGLSSLKVNLIVTEILDAARESARTGRRIDLATFVGSNGR